MGFENLDSDFDLSQVPVTVLSKEIELRHAAELAQEPIFEHIAHTDGLSSLLQIIVGHAVPFL